MPTSVQALHSLEKDFIDQTMEFFSGTYFTAPEVALNRPVSASEGTGMMISTLFAVDRRLNCDFALIMYSTRECECFSIDRFNPDQWLDLKAIDMPTTGTPPAKVLLLEYSIDRTSVRIRRREERRRSFGHFQKRDKRTH